LSEERKSNFRYVRSAVDPTETLAAGLDALTREDALFSDGFDMASVLFLGRRRIKTATSNLGDLGDAARG
jgi:hypothetical protein